MGLHGFHYKPVTRMNNSWIRYLPAFAYAELQKCVRGNKVKDVDNSRNNLHKQHLFEY
jgi:hypothetical protein